jgi:hypothetical protein
LAQDETQPADLDWPELRREHLSISGKRSGGFSAVGAPHLL